MASNRGKSRELRIIAGRWRGRRLRFPAGADIRPTPDRVRETLFNWLAPHLNGARVLDLFAGSGALGLEALSRGAAKTVFVDADPRVVAALRDVFAEWGVPTDAATALRVDAARMLDGPAERSAAPFDLVFIDPPFAAGLWQSVAGRLERGGWLAPQAFIYLEAPAGTALDGLPSGWTPWRSGKAGEVGYHLFRRGSVPDAAAGEIAGTGDQPT